MSDPLLDLIAGLPHASVAPERARLTRARCHRVLARHAPRPATARAGHSRAWSRAIIGLGTIYFAEAVRQMLRVYGIR